MVSFELGKDEEKYVFLSCHKHRTKKTPQTFRFCTPLLYHRDYGRQDPLGRLYT